MAGAINCRSSGPGGLDFAGVPGAGPSPRPFPSPCASFLLAGLFAGRRRLDRAARLFPGHEAAGDVANGFEPHILDGGSRERGTRAARTMEDEAFA